MRSNNIPETFTYDYPRMLVTVDIVAILKNPNSTLYKVLLIKRANNPYKDSYALPGGFPEMDELLKDAASRELAEETGLTNVHLTQLQAFDAPNRDPRDRNIAIAYTTMLIEEPVLQAGDDAAFADWFPLNNLPPLAFDHADIIRTARTFWKI